MQTPGETPIGDIVLTKEQSIQELRFITENMEKDLQEIISSAKKNDPVSKTKKKRHLKERKRKREEGDEEEETDEDEDISIRDGEKIFMRSRTSRVHYQDIVKEMEFIKGIPPALMIPNMIDWVLACEIKRSKCRNINSTIARQMREYLIKLYCVIGEIQKQQDNSEAEKLKKQVEDMRLSMMAFKEENLNLKKELEIIKRKVNEPTYVEIPINRSANKEREKIKE